MIIIYKYKNFKTKIQKYVYIVFFVFSKKKYDSNKAKNSC